MIHVKYPEPLRVLQELAGVFVFRRRWPGQVLVRISGRVSKRDQEPFLSSVDRSREGT